MEANVDRIILLPRFTSFAGEGTFLTAPLNVRQYGRAILYYAHVAALGASGTDVDVVVQQSPDLEIWADIGDPLGHDASEERGFRFEWIRLKLVVTGLDPGFTGWCVGDFVRRES